MGRPCAPPSCRDHQHSPECKGVGKASGVDVFLIVCALIASTFFRPPEKLIALPPDWTGDIDLPRTARPMRCYVAVLLIFRTQRLLQIERPQRRNAHRVHRARGLGNVKPTRLGQLEDVTARVIRKPTVAAHAVMNVPQHRSATVTATGQFRNVA